LDQTKRLGLIPSRSKRILCTAERNGSCRQWYLVWIRKSHW